METSVSFFNFTCLIEKGLRERRGGADPHPVPSLCQFLLPPSSVIDAAASPPTRIYGSIHTRRRREERRRRRLHSSTFDASRDVPSVMRPPPPFLLLLFSLSFTSIHTSSSISACETALCRIRREATETVEEITEHDKLACQELRKEYTETCAVATSAANKDSEFCEAFENVCFRIPESEPDQATVEPPPTTTTERPLRRKKVRDHRKFCAEYKQRYLYVCPDPFRFGQRAVVFCPIYSDRCHVPLPDKPVVPTRAPPRGARLPVIASLCNSYRGFAITYCNNPIFLAQPRYRDGCEKYWKFCTRAG